MDFEQLTLSRRTVHNFTREKVSDELVIEALRLSLWAPNHKLSFPWMYTWVGDKARGELAQLSVQLKSAKEPALNAVKEQATRDAVMNPSHLISLGIHRSKEHQEHEDYATLACSVQIASLFLWQNGIASKWSTGAFTVHPAAYEILGLDSSLIRLEGMLMVGKAQIVPPAHERPKLDRFLRRAD